MLMILLSTIKQAVLLYDGDGSSAAAATQIATLSAGLDLTNADIVVI